MSPTREPEVAMALSRGLRNASISDGLPWRTLDLVLRPRRPGFPSDLRRICRGRRHRGDSTAIARGIFQFTVTILVIDG